MFISEQNEFRLSDDFIWKGLIPTAEKTRMYGSFGANHILTFIRTYIAL